MSRDLASIRLHKGDARYLASVVALANQNIENMGCRVRLVDKDEFMATNRAYIDKRWYPLHDHYGHDRFIGLIVVDKTTGEVAGTVATRPADLEHRSVGSAFEDLRFAYPQGVPITATDRFTGIPRPLYGLKGKASYIGGFWMNPERAPGEGLSGSDLVSYLTRAIYAIILGTEDPDFLFAIMTDELLRGHDRSKSIASRYGFRHVANGPNWVNHYPGAELPDLKVNTVWMCRAGMLSVLNDTPWIADKVA